MKRFIACFEAHRSDGLVWAVRQGRKWRLAAALSIQVPIQTVYKGPTARQPKAYFVGAGRVAGNRARLTISAS